MTKKQRDLTWKCDCVMTKSKKIKNSIKICSIKWNIRQISSRIIKSIKVIIISQYQILIDSFYSFYLFYIIFNWNQKWELNNRKFEKKKTINVNMYVITLFFDEISRDEFHKKKSKKSRTINILQILIINQRHKFMIYFFSNISFERSSKNILYYIKFFETSTWIDDVILKYCKTTIIEKLIVIMKKLIQNVDVKINVISKQIEIKF